jgi:ADP-heptose:LPS heptosyltransferase
MKILVIRNDGIGDLVIFNYIFSNIHFEPTDLVHYIISCNPDTLNYFKPECQTQFFKFQRPAKYNIIQLIKFYLQIYRIKFFKYDHIIIPISSKNKYLLRYIQHLKFLKVITFKTDNINNSTKFVSVMHSYLHWI